MQCILAQFVSDSMMSPFKVLGVLIITFAMMDQALPHHLSNDYLTDSSQEDDLKSQTINREEQNTQTIKRKILHPSHNGQLVSHQGQIKDSNAVHPVNKADLMSRPSTHEATIQQQNQLGQVPNSPWNFPQETNTRENSYPQHIQVNKDSDMNLEKTNPLKTYDTLYAFMAELSPHTEVSAGSVVIYDNMQVNEGKRYFGSTGQFLLPRRWDLCICLECFNDQLI